MEHGPRCAGKVTSADAYDECSHRLRQPFHTVFGHQFHGAEALAILWLAGRSLLLC